MSGHDLSEIWIALRTALLADSTLTALLASSTAIYRGEPHTAVAFPHIVLEEGAENPQTDRSFTGIWRPDLTLSIYAKDRDRCEQIAATLDERWTIPVNRATEVASTMLRLTYLRRSGKSGPVPVRVLNTNESLFSLATFWQSRVSRKSS